MLYEYTKLIGPFKHRKKYNVFGLVKEIVKKPSHFNGKLTAKFSIIDETVTEPFIITIFCRTAGEVIPEITEGSVVRLHRMVAETFNDGFDGRVFSPNDVAFIPSEKLPDHEWISSAKRFTINDIDDCRVEELNALRELLDIDIREFLVDMDFN